MTFTYTRTVRAYFDPIREEYHTDDYKFDYTPEEDDITTALADILISKQNKGVLPNDCYNMTLKIVKDLINDQDLQDVLCDEFEDELKEWFEDEAMASEGDE